jgi:hypothetical protein
MQPSYGIPTTYRGINFRSRAEARWAAFFDEMAWAWQYEPLDFPGYIPDFSLFGRCFVEVKGGAQREEELRALAGSMHPKVDLLLGASPLSWTRTVERKAYRFESPAEIGLGRVFEWMSGQPLPGEEVLWIYCPEGEDEHDYAGCFGGYDCLCGGCSKEAHVLRPCWSTAAVGICECPSPTAPVSSFGECLLCGRGDASCKQLVDVRAAWAKACNATQWRRVG